MSKAKGFTFFENYYESISDPENGLTDEQRGLIYNAIITYVFTGKIVELKGVCRGFFNLIRPSLDVSRLRSDSGSKKTNSEETEDKGEAEEQQTENKRTTNGKQTKNKMESKDDSSPFYENKNKEQEREYKNKNKKNEQEEKRDIGEREEEKADVRSEAQRKFFERYPFEIDNYSAGDYAEIDFDLLMKCFDESKYLRETKSFSWVCHNYRKIAGGGYRDFDRGKKAESTDENGDTPEQAKRRAEFRAVYGDRGR
jgi:hypothetical protein